MASAGSSITTAPVSLATEIAEAHTQKLEEVARLCKQLNAMLPPPPKKPETLEEKKAFKPDSYKLVRDNLEYLCDVALKPSPNTYFKPVQDAIASELLAPLKSLVSVLESHQSELSADSNGQLLAKVFTILQYGFQVEELREIIQQIHCFTESSGIHIRAVSTPKSYTELLIHAAETRDEIHHADLYQVNKYHEAFEDDKFLCELLETAILNGSERTLKLIGTYFKEKGYQNPLSPSYSSLGSFWQAALVPRRYCKIDQMYKCTIKKLFLACNDQKQPLLHKLVESGSKAAIVFLKSMEQDFAALANETETYDFDKDPIPDDVREELKKVDTSELDSGWLMATEISANEAIINWGVQNEQGLRPVDVAIMEKRENLTEFLISCIGFEAVFTPDADSKQNILHLLVTYRQLDTINLLVARAKTKAQQSTLKRHLNQGNIRGDTPLHLAYSVQRKDIAQRLLDLGANPKAKNNTGLFPKQMVPKAYCRT